MLDSIAALFGMGIDDLVKLITAFAMGVATIMGAVAKMLIAIRGARRRSFVKIRRIEDILLEQERARIGDAPFTGLYAAMKDDQRDMADQRDLES